MVRNKDLLNLMGFYYKMCNLQHYYLKNIVPQFLNKKEFSNVMSVPKITKIVLNTSFGALKTNKTSINNIKNELMLISGQKVVITKARKSISSFKLRKGEIIGCSVTLRRARMYDFLERLLFVAIPRITDFRGLNTNSFDGNGNFSLGVKEQIIFSEIDYDSVDSLRGLDITIVTSASTDSTGLALLKAFNFPFKKIIN